MAKPVRNVFCSWYPFCLNVHVRNNKLYFTCSGCTRYRPLFFTPEEIAADALSCAALLRELFFGPDPYERDEMKKTFSDDEMVLVPARFLKGIIFSFAQGMSYFTGTSNLIEKLDGILKREKTHGQFVSDVPGNTSEGGPRTEGL